MRKRLLAILMALTMLMVPQTTAMAAVPGLGEIKSFINDLLSVTEASQDASINIKQTKSGCVLSSTAMMLRQKAINDKNDNWKSITESTVKKKGATSGGSQYNSFTYSDNAKGLKMGVKSTVLYSMVDKKGKRNKDTNSIINRLKKELDKHKEGIVLYTYRFNNDPNKQHAVYLSSYSGNTFYCIDPANGKNFTLDKCTLSGKKYANSKRIEDILSYSVKIWYLSSSSNKATNTEYSITYYIDGTKVNAGNPTSYKYNTGTITLKNPTVKGYIFSGWYSSKSFTYQNRVTQISTTQRNNITLYGSWSKNFYTITYYLDGGTNSSWNPSTYNIDSGYISLYTPTKSGYTFEGWYTDYSLNSAYRISGFSSGELRDIALHAKWRKIETDPEPSEPVTPIVKETITGNWFTLTHKIGAMAVGYPLFTDRGNYWEFIFEKQSDNTYVIRNKETNCVLGLDNISTSELVVGNRNYYTLYTSRNIYPTLQSYNGTDSQKWIMEGNKNGFYLKNKSNGLYLQYSQNFKLVIYIDTVTKEVSNGDIANAPKQIENRNKKEIFSIHY